ncbi:hypothetical protein EDB84DRAFT_1584602 [Lactarius hengduanensis]|nr:hypothetical protein EDB84DRAFT_1584602 [Lactarius hengduanensis]
MFLNSCLQPGFLRIANFKKRHSNRRIGQDGQHIVSGSGDRTIRVWNTTTGETEAGPFTGHTDSVSSVAFSPDGQRIVSYSHDRTIRHFFAIVALTFIEHFFLSFDSSPPTLPQTRSASRDRLALPEASRFRPFRPPLFALLDSTLLLPTFPTLTSFVLPPFFPFTEFVRVSTVSYAFRFHLAPVIWESYQDLFCDLHRSHLVSSRL